MSMTNMADDERKATGAPWYAYALPVLLAGYSGILWGVATRQAWIAALTAASLFLLSAAGAGLLSQAIGSMPRFGQPTMRLALSFWHLILALALPISSALLLWLWPGAIAPRGHIVNGVLALSVVGVSAFIIRRTRPARPATRPASGATPSLTHRLWLRSLPFWGACLLVSVTLWLALPHILPPGESRLTLSYSAFRQQVVAGNVAEITEYGETQRGMVLIKGRFTAPVRDPQTPGDQGSPARAFEMTVPPFVDRAEVGALLDQAGVPITAQMPDTSQRDQMMPVVLAVVPALIFIVALWFIVGARHGRDGLMSLGRSRARRYGAADPADRARITFADVAGIDESKAELTELVDFLRQPEKYQRLGGVMPRGVLLIGPPGTGKTLLARAVAGEAGVPFFSISGSEFVEVYVGVGASRVRDLFAQARKASPAIIFIDELDAIGQRRGTQTHGRNDEREQTLNQILVEMDGFDASQAVIVVAATNRVDVLDPALLRPGRFDRRVTVHAPNRAGRAAILAVHARGVPLSTDVDLNRVAGQTAGLVGAELRNLINEAALLAARRNHQMVTADDFAEALEKIALGPERQVALAPEERERVAYHEAGHALLGLLQPESDPVRRVTVVPRGQALGVTLSAPEQDRYNYGEGYIRARIITILGGRAAEQVVYGNWTTGAENDIRQATNLARAMVTRWGMSPEVGMVALAGANEGNHLDDPLSSAGGRPFSERMASLIDDAIKGIIDESFDEAVAMLARERARLEGLTEALLREEALDEDEMLAATGLARPDTTPVAAPI